MNCKHYHQWNQQQQQWSKSCLATETISVLLWSFLDGIHMRDIKSIRSIKLVLKQVEIMPAVVLVQHISWVSLIPNTNQEWAELKLKNSARVVFNWHATMMVPQEVALEWLISPRTKLPKNSLTTANGPLSDMETLKRKLIELIKPLQYSSMR